MVDAISFSACGVDGFEDDDAEKNYRVAVRLSENAENIDTVALNQFTRVIEKGHLDDKIARWTVDGVVEVMANSPEERQEKIDNWASRYRITLFFGFANLAAMISAVAIGFLKMSPDLLPTKLDITVNPYICGAIAVATAALAILNFVRSSQAKEQRAIWKTDPAEAILEARKSVLEKENGFFDVINGLWTIHPKLPQRSYFEILSRSEVLYLYRKTFESWKQILDAGAYSPIEERAKIAKSFAFNNPLAQKALNAAYPNKTQEKLLLQPYSDNFGGYYAQIHDLNRWFDGLRKEAERVFDGARSTTELKRTALLTPIDMVYVNYADRARKEMEQAIPNPINRTSQNLEYARYLERLATYRTNSNLAKIPINLYFDSEINRLKGELQEELNRFERERDKSLEPFFEQAHHLLNNAYSVYIGHETLTPPATYQPPQYSTVLLQPSAPPAPPQFEQNPDYQKFMGGVLPTAPEKPPQKLQMQIKSRYGS